MPQNIPRNDRGSRFLASAPTFGQRLDQLLADARDRLELLLARRTLSR